MLKQSYTYMDRVIRQWIHSEYISCHRDNTGQHSFCALFEDLWAHFEGLVRNLIFAPTDDHTTHIHSEIGVDTDVFHSSLCTMFVIIHLIIIINLRISASVVASRYSLLSDHRALKYGRNR